MRKSLLLLGSLLLVSSYIYAEEVTTESSTEAEGKHPYKEVSVLSKTFTSWSLSIEGGINLIDGDFIQTGMTIVPTSRLRPTAALSLTYDFTPVWGLVGTYSYAPYGVKKDNGDWSMKGQMHTIEALLSIDLVDAWFPYRKKDIFSFYFLAGAGLGFYQAEYYNPNNGGAPDYAVEDNGYAMTGVLSIGAAAEFNVSRSIGIGLKGLYHIYTVDDIDARIKGTSNDCMEYASLYLRWKIASKRNNHRRNYAYEDALLYELGEKRLLADNGRLIKDTVVIQSVDTVVSIERVESELSEPQIIEVVEKQIVKHHLNTVGQCHYVYFANNDAELSEEALRTIQQVAARLEADTTLCLEVSGFCDNTGSEEHNKQLAKRRADRVVKELTNIYKVGADRLLPISQGKINNVDSSYGPNRRVELRLRSREELNQLREEQTVQTEAKKTSTVAIQTTNVLQKRPIKETIIADANDNFSRLAKEHYGNPYCWPYIYAANPKAVLNNDPDKLMRDAKVVIPELADAEIESATKQTVTAMVEAIQAQ